MSALAIPRRRVSQISVVVAITVLLDSVAIGVSWAEPDPSMEIDAPQALRLEEVLDSVDRFFPTLRALRSEAAARRGDLLAARGEFDLSIRASGDWQPEGFYESRRGAVGVDAPTRLWGARLGADYRLGAGDVPSYYGDRITDRSGEVALSLEVPLLRGGATDPNRTAIDLAEVEVERMDPRLRAERLARIRDASSAYWSWLGTGRRLEIAERLLEVARVRQSQIARRVEQGAEPRIDLSDNERLIVERRVALRGAERDFEQASIRLGLFLRDESGDPVLSRRTALPVDFPPELPPADEELERDLAFAQTQHPRLAEFGFRRAALEVELAQVRNDLLPNLDFNVQASRDLGRSRGGIDQVGSFSAESRSSTEITAGFRFELPVQQRRARGRAAALKARLDRVAAQGQWAREQVVADARGAWASLRAAHDQTAEARENVRLAEKLRAAENRRFGLGRSNLIDVNIREVQAATAARELVDAQANYFIALADYQARVGRERDIEPEHGLEGRAVVEEAQLRAASRSSTSSENERFEQEEETS